MTARFHSSSIDRLALTREGYGVIAERDGEIVAIFNVSDEGKHLKRGEPEFERILTKCMITLPSKGLEGFYGAGGTDEGAK